MIGAAFDEGVLGSFNVFSGGDSFTSQLATCHFLWNMLDFFEAVWSLQWFYNLQGFDPQDMSSNKNYYKGAVFGNLPFRN